MLHPRFEYDRFRRDDARLRTACRWSCNLSFGAWSVERLQAARVRDLHKVVVRTAAELRNRLEAGKQGSVKALFTARVQCGSRPLIADDGSRAVMRVVKVAEHSSERVVGNYVGAWRDVTRVLVEQRDVAPKVSLSVIGENPVRIRVPSECVQLAPTSISNKRWAEPFVFPARWTPHSAARDRVFHGTSTTESTLKVDDDVIVHGFLSGTEPPTLLSGAEWYAGNDVDKYVVGVYERHLRAFRWTRRLLVVASVALALAICLRYARRRRQKQQQHDALENNHPADGALPEDDDDDETLCKLCYTKPLDVVLVPCGHMLFCTDCVPRLEAAVCPICRASVRRYQRVYRA